MTSSGDRTLAHHVDRLLHAAQSDDVELVAGLREDDARCALADAYRRYGAAVYAVAYRVLGDAGEAEDVTHDVFVGLPEALHGYEERGAFGGWLRRVAARVALSRLRSRRRRHEVALPPEDELPTVGATVADLDLARALAALPDDLRTVVVLKVMEGFTHAEVGRELGITEGASRVRLTRALARLRQSLGGER